MEYIILHDDTTDALAAQVNECITDGWKPQGGASVAGVLYYDETDLQKIAWDHCQAMIKEDEE